MSEKLQLKIALNFIPFIGPRLVRRLIAYAGSVEAVFSEKAKVLEKIPGIGTKKASGIQADQLLKKAEPELEYILKNNIDTHFYLDENYPERLRECEDAPILIYSKGNVNFNTNKVISMVGTRNASEYGKAVTEEIVTSLADNYPDLLIVSGLAYGIDIAAHKAALKNGLETIAVMAHGFEYMYPALHASVAREIKAQGALVTEFQSRRKPDPGNFISRNRIIAGLADATVVIESASKGGALITSDLAISYNREVFAVPGRVKDKHSKGCNDLIRLNKAGLISCGADLEYGMGWMPQSQLPVQKELFISLNKQEEEILAFLKEKGNSSFDAISRSLNLAVALVSANLLSLEFKGVVKSLPGNVYSKI